MSDPLPHDPAAAPGRPDAAWPLTRRRLDDAQRALFDRRMRIIGWGTGSVFDYFQRRFPVRLDYLVDNDATRWGGTRQGVPIHAPSILTEETGRDALVIVYSSAWPEIQRQLAALADLPSLPASAAFADAPVRATLATADLLAADAPRREGREGRDAIVVQGPVVPYTTAYVVRAMSARHPEAQIVLSTWDDTPREALEAVAPWTDDVVLGPRPSNPGIQNRNLQIASTRAGIARAIARGARTVLKTRTDLAVLQPEVFRQARWWCARLDQAPARRLGQRGRLVVPSSYTRKYMLYHPSDLVMLGAAEDLERYWSAPLDERAGSLLAAEWLDQPLAQVNLAGNPTESYLGLAFCRTLGRPIAGTLDDSWAFYRDSFAVVDHAWLDLLWCKHLAVPDTGLVHDVRETVTQAFWQRLQLDPALPSTRLDPYGLPLRALTEAAA
ncbi:MAG: WavE lipopolysaccharide synthesis family protein [Vicinamibacterales bacterium]